MTENMKIWLTTLVLSTFLSGSPTIEQAIATPSLRDSLVGETLTGETVRQRLLELETKLPPSNAAGLERYSEVADLVMRLTIQGNRDDVPLLEKVRDRLISSGWSHTLADLAIHSLETLPPPASGHGPSTFLSIRGTTGGPRIAE